MSEFTEETDGAAAQIVAYQKQVSDAVASLAEAQSKLTALVADQQRRLAKIERWQQQKDGAATRIITPKQLLRPTDD